jgi:hypothetical protein
MSLRKAIEHGKERRRPWHDSRDFDSSCRNHRGCPWCEGNRAYQSRKQEIAARAALLDEVQNE